MPTYTLEENIRWFKSRPAKPMGSAAVFRNSHGNILIVKPNYRDVWNFPSGVVDENESPLQAVVREIKEEIGLTKGQETLELKVVNYRPAKGGYPDSLYFLFDGGQLADEEVKQIRMDESELDEMKFCTPEEALKLLGESKAACLKYYLQDPDKVWYLENNLPI